MRDVASSADDQPAEFRCPSCPKRNGQAEPAKNEEPSDQEPERFYEKQLLDRVERFARERDSGRRVYELLLPLEWELLIIRDETIEKYKRGMDINVAMALEILCASVMQGR